MEYLAPDIARILAIRVLALRVAWLRLVADALPNDTVTVGEHFTEEDLQRLKQQAKDQMIV